MSNVDERYPDVEDYHYPCVDKLDAEDVGKLQFVTADNLNCKVESTFSDDGLLCLDVVVNGVCISIWRLDDEQAAAFHYLDTERGRRTVADIVKHQLFLRDELLLRRK